MVDSEDDEDDVGVVVAQWTEPVKVLLAGGIPEGELDEFRFVVDLGHKVLKDCWNVVLHQPIESDLRVSQEQGVIGGAAEGKKRLTTGKRSYA
jgi:hypothetical protein